jgi:hypothetical protein
VCDQVAYIKAQFYYGMIQEKVHYRMIHAPYRCHVMQVQSHCCTMQVQRWRNRGKQVKIFLLKMCYNMTAGIYPDACSFMLPGGCIEGYKASKSDFQGKEKDQHEKNHFYPVGCICPAISGSHGSDRV